MGGGGDLLGGASGDDIYEDSVDSIPLNPPTSPTGRKSSNFTERDTGTQLEWLYGEEEKLTLKRMRERK